MNKSLTKKWVKNLKILDIAFQPILNIHTGKLYGVEALLRNYQEVGYDTVYELFDNVYEDNLLYSFDLKLRKKAIKKFTKINGFEDIKLFYNLDNRVLEMPDFASGNTIKLLKHYGMDKNRVCFEISERQKISDIRSMQEILSHYKEENFCIAVDDFGVGYSGYKLLYESKPDIIKIDRFFLTDIDKDIKKKLIARNITQLALQLSIKVIAEGVETKEEFLTCKEIGCHLVQGYFVQRATLEIAEILQEYGHIKSMIESQKRGECTSFCIEGHIDTQTPFWIQSDINSVVEYFRGNPESALVVIVNSSNEPLGILKESHIKSLVYSPYGRSLLKNDSIKKSKIKNLLLPCAIAEITLDMNTIVELFANNPESLGIIVTKNFKYHGFLSAHSIITIMNEQNIIFAREQNPLTKLPGNSMIEKYIAEAARNRKFYILCYFDLDNFKAFNDVYGFRNGDRAIQLFADTLRKSLPQEFFKAHIGGDDFFVALECALHDKNRYVKELYGVVKKFSSDARELYLKEDKQRCYIVSIDREGNKKRFKLLSVSASVIVVRPEALRRSIESIIEALSIQKKSAKKSPSHVSVGYLL